MGKEREKERGDKRNMFNVGFVINCAAEIKVVLTALLILCGIATLLQILPPRFTISASDLRFCISRITTTPTTTSTSFGIANTSTSNTTSNSTSASIAPLINSSVGAAQPPEYHPPQPPLVQKDQVTDNGVIKRVFNPYGAASYNFITMGAYRGGLNTFAVIGLSSKPLHLYAKPTYQCEWVPQSPPPSSSSSNTTTITTVGYKILPDWGYGHVYTVVVVNCTFPQRINADDSGGKLFLHASTSGGGDKHFNITDRFEVLAEHPGNLNLALFTSKPKYDYLYCGSSLYGALSPKRVREWIAYHVKLFGERSHFVIHDAGGVHEEVMEVLKPWIELGYVTLQDIREQERFDGYYHNQFMVVNDCLHRYKFMAKWMFFFDVDEYIYVPPKNTIKSVLDSLKDYNQFTIEQMPMSSKLCLHADYGRYYRYSHVAFSFL